VGELVSCCTPRRVPEEYSVCAASLSEFMGGPRKLSGENGRLEKYIREPSHQLRRRSILTIRSDSDKASSPALVRPDDTERDHGGLVVLRCFSCDSSADEIGFQPDIFPSAGEVLGRYIEHLQPALRM
jgi:hypothetical protein